jgi:hypothetical protein
MAKNLKVSWLEHDKRVLRHILQQLGVTEAVLLPNRNAKAVALRANIFAMIRSARTKHCHQIPWLRIRDAVGFSHHSGIIRAVQLHVAKFGEVKEFFVDAELPTITEVPNAS